MIDDTRKPSLLIVDDEDNFRESLTMALEAAFTVSQAGSLATAREEIRGRVPDAILLDIRLPDGEGTELLRDLKSYRRLPVVIVMTAHAAMECAVSALREGAVACLAKPFDIEMCRRKLALCLEKPAL
jgi:DNA-binding NtrC family response regulator